MCERQSWTGARASPRTAIRCPHCPSHVSDGSLHDLVAAAAFLVVKACLLGEYIDVPLSKDQLLMIGWNRPFT